MMASTRRGQRISVHPALNGDATPLLEALLGCTEYGILITQNDTRQDLVCNARFGEMFDIDPEAAVHVSPDLVRGLVLPRIKDPDGFLEDLRFVYAHPRLERADELELTGPEKVFRRHTAPLLDEEAKLLGRVWTFLDVTDVRQMQREIKKYTGRLEELVDERTSQLQTVQDRLIEKEKLDAVGLLAAAVAHHIRNVLTPLKMELSAITDSDGLPPDIEPIIENQVQRLTTLTHQLLSIFKPVRLEISRMDLRGAWGSIEPILTAQAEAMGCKLEVELPSEPIWVEVSREQIEHVFVNLAMNALTAMSATGGTLTVEIQQKQGLALASFTDTGPGVPEQVEERLFEPFVTGRAEGTGLGLFSSRRIAQEHGGNLTLERTSGNTRFVLRLPVYDPDEAQAGSNGGEGR